MPRTYAEYQADVSRPGKFEGQAPYVPYFYEALLDGFGTFDGLGGRQMTRFTVEAADRAIFPELKGRRTVAIVVTGEGFVVEA